MRPTLRLLALLPPLLLCACEAPLSCDLSDPAAAWLTLGDGTDGFVPIDDGDTLLVERGSQGGMHVIVAARTAAIHPGQPTYEDGLRAGDLPVVELGIDDAEGGQLNAEHRQPRVLQRRESDYELDARNLPFRHFAQLPDNWTELDYADVEADMEQAEFRLWMTLEDSCGTTVTAERTVRLDFPERNPDVG